MDLFQTFWRGAPELTCVRSFIVRASCQLLTRFCLLSLHRRVAAWKRDDHSGQTDCRKIKHDPVDYSRPLPEKEGIFEESALTSAPLDG